VSTPTTLCRGKDDQFFSHSVEDPIVLLGDDDSSASEAEVDDNGLRAESAAPDAGLFDSPETAVLSVPISITSSYLAHDQGEFLPTRDRCHRRRQRGFAGVI
jgi:hypothetical protein